MLPGVSPHHTPHVPELCRVDERDGECGRTCGDVVNGVVGSCTRPSEVLVALGAMTDHRVERVDGTVREYARRAGNRRPQQRGGDGIDRVLRDGLDRGSADLRLVELVSAAPNQRT